jgi:hypothetical protein
MARVNTDWHLDEGKPRVDLVPVLALIEVGKVMAYGEKKYGQHNWSKHAGRWAWTQLTASALRHLYAWMTGEDNDQESGLNHLAHVLANIMMLLDLVVLGQGDDDRNPVYKPEPESDAWAEFDKRFLEQLKKDNQYHPKTQIDGYGVPLIMEVTDEELHDPEGWLGGETSTGRDERSADRMRSARHPDEREGSVTEKQ